MDTSFSVAFAPGPDRSPRQIPSWHSSPGSPETRQMPCRSVSLRSNSRVQRDRRMTQEVEWHSQLIQMDEVTTKMLSKQISFLSKEQDSLSRQVANATAETKIVESFLQHLCSAQRQLSDDLTIGCGIESVGSNLDPTGIDGEWEPSVAVASLQKSIRLMARKIETLGITMLQEALDRISETSSILAVHSADLDQIRRTDIKQLQESETNVKKAWDKYFSDATILMNYENRGLPQFDGSSVTDPSTSFPASQLPRNKSRIPPRTRSFDREPRLGSNKSYIGRAASNAADLIVVTTDVWLSEWSYRWHLMEQATQWERSAQRMRQLFLSIQGTEVTRRLQFYQDLLLIAKNQQKLTVTLGTASALGLIEYLEGQSRISEEEKRETGDTATSKGEDRVGLTLAFGSRLSHSEKSALSGSTALPLLMDSGFVTLTTLVKRVAMRYGAKPVLSLMVVTSEGLWYFFDLPSGCEVPFDKSSSSRQAWQALVEMEATKLQDNGAGEGNTHCVSSVTLPVPSLRLVLSLCSMEMARADCVVKISVPRRLGEDFSIEFSCTGQEVAFIKAFQKCTRRR